MNSQEEAIPLDEAIVLLNEAREEQAKTDEQLKNILKKIGFELL
jgi:type I restriction enzyme M protein